MSKIWSVPRVCGCKLTCNETLQKGNTLVDLAEIENQEAFQLMNEKFRDKIVSLFQHQCIHNWYVLLSCRKL